MPRAGGGGAAAHNAVSAGNRFDPNEAKKAAAAGEKSHTMHDYKAERQFMENLRGSADLDDLHDTLNNEDKFAEMVDKYSREVFHHCEALPAVVLMNEGRFEDLTTGDMKELFKALDADDSGNLEFEEIELLLKELLVPPLSDEQVDAIYELIDLSEDGKASPEELYKALKGPVKHEMKRMQTENRLVKEMEIKFGHNLPTTRELLIDRLKWSVNRDDAFRTLPSTIVYICIFTFLVVAHLKIYPRGQMERGLEAWIDDYGEKLTGPYLGNTGDMDGMFDWLTASGLPAVLADCSVNAAAQPVCRVGMRGIFLGDALLRQTRRDGSERSEWLLNSEVAKSHLRATPGDYLGAAVRATSNMRTSGWADEDTMSIILSFGVCGERPQLFAIVDVKCSFDDYGAVKPVTAASSVVMLPYPLDIPTRVIYFVLDAAYLLFLLIPMYKELKDLIHGMHMTGAWDGLVHYMGFWNGVDWICILTGLSSIAVWTLACQAIIADSIQSHLKEHDGRMVLASGGMQLSVGVIEELHEAFQDVIDTLRSLRYVNGITACAIMMKFFKAFQANPRLQLVTNTMMKCSSDIVHFSIVFLAVFVGFAVTGHIMFGNDLKEFRSFATSLDTCFIVLMGDFVFYAEQSEADLGLDSGMPYMLLAAWFWLYMMFVLMILLNMLLAIILDHYTELVTQIKMDLHVPSLREQTLEYIEHHKATKGHIPQLQMLHLLTDDDANCHPHDMVSNHSLMEAFPTMDRAEADHIFEWLKVEAKKSIHDKDDEVAGRIKAMAEQVENLMEDLKVVKLNCAVCASRLKLRSGGAPDSPGGNRNSRVSVSPGGRPASARGKRPSSTPSPRSPGGRKSVSPMSPGRDAFSPHQAALFADQIDQLTMQLGSSIRGVTERVKSTTKELSVKGTARTLYRQQEQEQTGLSTQAGINDNSGRQLPPGAGCLTAPRRS